MSLPGARAPVPNELPADNLIYPPTGRMATSDFKLEQNIDIL